MFNKAFAIIILFASLSFADFIGLTPIQLQEKIDKNITLIDIRTPPEWIQTGIVPTSNKIMFFDEKGNYNVEAWLEKFGKLVKDKNQPFVLVCRSGNRTGSVGNFLSNKLNFKNVYHLQDGINSWIKENRKITHEQ
ncbi:MAG: rhodanese-like domain-containing protein [Campylobacterota bacterium]|nr:rhodanese-like domain-containing protein [Campylobacterota bacterium]